MGVAERGCGSIRDHDAIQLLSTAVMATRRKTKALAEPKSEGEIFTFFFGSASPFSQWHPSVFTVDGVEFCCAEQFMMYRKAGKWSRPPNAAPYPLL